MPAGVVPAMRHWQRWCKLTHTDNATLQTLRQLAIESPVVMEPLRAEYKRAIADNDPQVAKRIEEIATFLFGDSWVNNG